MTEAFQVDCGLDGNVDDLVKVRSVNVMLNRINRHHVQPLKHDVCEMRKKLNAHIDDEAELLAEIRGALKVIKVLGIAAVILLGFLGVPQVQDLIKLFHG